ncbi:D-aminopeptidase [Plastoroseomonas arctica]|uniref:D-aminopeptidase n=1 Tax=Plastoroseomonas arctica TaxID=1509237 RepID=A0AAF1K5P9_9PROT|nr:D-aminopeptidase [Plastoroseomonas arctica]MBR0656810.1 D-aminopeptidase [Plastoroseomonas arctica]
MAIISYARVHRRIASLPREYPGPGGAVAVLRRGEVVARHSWGWANAERRIPFTPRSLFRMCSITKQFTCALLLDSFPDPTVLDADVRQRLPLLDQAVPGALHLAHNQSGLRDYWAVAMLHGSPVEAPFGATEAQRLIGATRSLHFAPGTRYSYVNQNFRILSDILEARTGRSFGELLRTRIFEPAGMHTAFVAEDTRAMPDGTEGYEGSQERGFRAAENRILWTGDAGLGASLDDMIAWEQSVDASRDDPEALYSRMARPVAFADGSPALYGFGLARGSDFGEAWTGHGGALRGWRSHRLYLAKERLSVVVMFNHLADAHAAALDVLGAALGKERPAHAAGLPDPIWLGIWREAETGLAARTDRLPDGAVRLRYGHSAERLELREDGSASNGRTTLRHAADGLHMARPQENQASRLVPLAGEARADVGGRYHCAELDATLTVADAGGTIYAAFCGMLGEGRMELLEPIGRDVWLLPCPRALDHTPPGDWTLAFRRDGRGAVESVQVGCWLARNLTYTRLPG